jgi:hypothetical protein
MNVVVLNEESNMPDNRVQFSLNSELLEDLNHTIWALDYSKTDYAREKIGDIKDKIAKRNKLIKIADTSEGGFPDPFINFAKNTLPVR